jgi:hypothetical protein
MFISCDKDTNAVQPWNAFEPILVMFDVNVIDVTELQFEKAFSPIYVMLWLNERDVTDEHPWNAPELIDRSPLLNTIDVTPVWFWKTFVATHCMLEPKTTIFILVPFAPLYIVDVEIASSGITAAGRLAIETPVITFPVYEYVAKTLPK